MTKNVSPDTTNLLLYNFNDYGLKSTELQGGDRVPSR